MTTARRSCATSSSLALLLLVSLACGCGGPRDTRLLDLQAMQQAGDFEETIEPLRGMLADAPDDPDANYLLGLALLRTRRAKLSIPPLEKAAASDKHAVAAGLTLASTLYNAKSYERAIEVASRVLERDPEVTSALYLRAHAALAWGRPEAALADAERVLKIQPDDFRAYTLKAGALVDLGRYDEAEEMHERMQQVAAAAGDTDGEARSCAVLARFRAGRGDTEQAESAFADCLARFPTHPVVLRLAAAFEDRRGDAEAGNAIWRRAIEAHPDAYALRAELTERLEAQGRPEQAEAELLEATRRFDTPRAWLKLAAFRRRQSDWRGALEATEQAIERAGPSSEPLRYQQADLLVSLGQLDDAQQIASRLTQREYKDLIRARILLERGESQAALDAVEAALERQPGDARARLLAGRAAERLGDSERALAEYRAAFDADPAFTDAALAAARIELALGDHAAAAEWVETALAQGPGARRDAYVLAVRVAVAHRRWDQARSWLARLQELPGADPVQVALERAEVERRATGPAASLAILEGSGLDLADPANSAVLSALLEDLLSLGRGAEALARVEAAASAHPRAPAFHDLRGRVLLRQGRAGEARRAFERALEAQLGYAPALQGLASLAIIEGRADEALALARRATEADPSQVDAAFVIAQSLIRLGRNEEAERELRRTLALQPAHAGASNDLAWLLAERGGELDLSLALARRAVELAPLAMTYDTLGWVQLKRGEPRAAAESFRRGLQMDGATPSMRYHLGLALVADGQGEQALALFKEALSAGEFEEAEAARSEIARLERR